MRNKLFALMAALLFMVAVSFAANTDRYYQGTVTPVDIGYTQVGYQWSVTIGADSSDQLHSDAMFIGDCNSADGMVVAIVSAVSDVNVFYHYSIDGVTWFTTVTVSGLDATSSTAKQDTIGYQAGANDIAFSAANWLIVEIDGGSTACNSAEVVTITFAFTKDLSYAKPNGERIVVQSVKTAKPSAWTNP